MINTSLIFCLMFLSACTFSPDPDIYWRKYHGNMKVPEDAVPVGQYNGTKVYVGRAPFEIRGLLIGSITPGVGHINGTHWSVTKEKSAAYAVYTNIEILCSRQPDKFVWVKTNSTTLLRIPGLVQGGFEIYGKKLVSGPLYIGRVHDSQEYRIGKVVGYYILNLAKNRLYYPVGQEQKETNNFQVLAYKIDADPNASFLCPCVV